MKVKKHNEKLCKDTAFNNANYTENPYNQSVIQFDIVWWQFVMITSSASGLSLTERQRKSEREKEQESKRSKKRWRQNHIQS